MILGENGDKMSKSRGNVVNPDDIVNEYGADTFRMYEMFMGDFEKAAPWSQSSIKGCSRFLDRVWGLQDMVADEEGYSADMESTFHKLIKKVSEDIMHLGFNTAIAAMMSAVNDLYAKKSVTKGELKTLILLLSPFAPHMAEEMWAQQGYEGLASVAQWPEYDEAKCVDSTVEIPVQVNGKLRGKVTVAADSDKDHIIALALEEKNVKAQLEGKSIVKQIYVPGKLVNIVAK